MADIIRLQDWVESKGLETNLESLIKKLLTVIDTTKQANSAFQSGQKTQSETSKRIKDTSDNLDKLSAVEKEVQRIYKQGEKITYDVVKAQEENKKKRREVTEQVKKENKELQQNKTFLQQVNGAVKSGIAQFALMAGAIGLSIGGLVKFGKSILNATDTMQDKWEVAMAKARAATDTFFKAVANVSFKDFISNLGKAVEAAGKYAEAMDIIEDRTRAATVQEQKKEYLVGQQLKILKDQTKDYDTRKKAGEEILRLEKEYADTQKSIAGDNKTNIVDLFASKGITEDILTANLENYEANKDIIQQADVYNKALKERAAFEKMGSQGADLSQSKAYAAVQKTIAETDADIVKFAELRLKYGDLNKKQMDEAAKVFSDYYKSLGLFDSETQRVSATVSGLLVKENKLIDKNATKAVELAKLNYKEGVTLRQMELDDKEMQVDQTLQMIESMTDQQINAQKDAYLSGKISAEELAKSILEIQISSMQDQLAIADLTAEQEQEIENKILEAKIALYDADVKANEDAEEKKTKKAEEEADKRKEKAQQVINDIQEIGNAAFAASDALLDMQSNNIEIAYQHEIDMAHGSKEAIAKIDKKYDEERRKLQRKQAIADKLQGIFSASINTANAITEALPNIPLAIIIGILGAIQIGIIAAKKIPSFAKGVKGFEGGTAEVGEQGRELLISPLGQMALTPDKSTVINLPKGTDVIPHYETEKMLQNGGITVDKWDEFVKSHNRLSDAILNRPIKETNFTERGLEHVEIINNTRRRYINKYMRGE